MEKEVLNSSSISLSNNEENLLHELNSIETPILDALEVAMKNPATPLHIPGHARGEGVLPKFKELFGEKMINLDSTDEFNGVGKLYPADGAIAKSQDLTAELFGAEKSFFLVNGSSVGNLALALTVAKDNKKIIIGRNCHRSVITGLTLTGADPLWVVPQWLNDFGIWGAVEPKEIEKLLDENEDVSAVWITNPTYEGVVSDNKEIARICKERGVAFIVDEAHGCLWQFSDKLPVPALECGADAVVHSLHKTGGSFSQSSVLHIAKNSKINIDEIDTNLGMLQSTSPSVPLLTSLDAARAYLASQYGEQKIISAIKNAEEAINMLKQIEDVNCLSKTDGIDLDITKIYITVDGLSGKRLQSILEIEYNIEIEAATDEGILALSNIGNTPDELYNFCEAIRNISEKKYSDITHLEKARYMPLFVPQIVCTPRKAYVAEKEEVSAKNAIGRISAEIYAVCPPGISVLVPGEMITKEHIPYLINKQTVQVVKG